MSYYLLKWNDVSDGIKIQGSTVLNETQFKEYEDNVKVLTSKTTKIRKVYIDIGKNDTVEYSSRNKLLKTINVSEISEEYYDVLKNLDMLSFGHIEAIDFILNKKFLDKKVNEKFYSLDFYDNWADEIDLDGYVTFTEKEYKEYEKAAQFVKDNADKIYINLYVGSNESLEYHSPTDIFKHIHVKEISRKEYLARKSSDTLYGGYQDWIDYFLEKEYLDCIDED